VSALLAARADRRPHPDSFSYPVRRRRVRGPGASALLQHRGVIVGVMSGCVLAALAVGLLLASDVHGCVFLHPPVSESLDVSLGIAEQFGLSVPVGDAGENPAFLRGVSQVPGDPRPLQWTAAIRSRPIPALSVAR